MFVGFALVTRMLVLVGPVVAIMLVLVPCSFFMAVSMNMEMVMLVTVVMAVLVFVGFRAVTVFVGMHVAMFMHVRMAVLVGSFHDFASCIAG